MKYEISKSHIESYKLRTTGSYGSGWADISIDTQPGSKHGRIQIASDYGDWQYFWGCCGSSFKEFLTGLSLHYVAGKFGAGRWFDIEGTIRLNKGLIIDYRKSGDLDASMARKMWEELNEMGDCHTAHEFVSEWYSKDNLPFFFEESPDCSYDVDPRFRAFWDNCWSAFCEELKRELQTEPSPSHI